MSSPRLGPQGRSWCHAIRSSARWIFSTIDPAQMVLLRVTPSPFRLPWYDPYTPSARLCRGSAEKFKADGRGDQECDCEDQWVLGPHAMRMGIGFL